MWIENVGYVLSLLSPKSYYDKDKEQILTTKLVAVLDYKFT